MRITSVKLLKDGAAINWQDRNGEEVTLHQLKNGGEPRPGFRKAVEALKGDVEHLMGLPAEWMEDVEAKGLTVSYDDDGTRDVSVSFTKRFPSGRAKGYSTVGVREATDDGQNGNSFMSGDMEKRVDKVLAEAEKYLKGQRAQTEH